MDSRDLLIKVSRTRSVRCNCSRADKRDAGSFFETRLSASVPQTGLDCFSPSAPLIGVKAIQHVAAAVMAAPPPSQRHAHNRRLQTINAVHLVVVVVVVVVVPVWPRERCRIPPLHFSGVHQDELLGGQTVVLQDKEQMQLH